MEESVQNFSGGSNPEDPGALIPLSEIESLKTKIRALRFPFEDGQTWPSGTTNNGIVYNWAINDVVQVLNDFLRKYGD
jgi:hypothetical protein